MITDPDRYAEAFVEAGADMLSVHVEVLPHLHRTIGFIKSLGVKAGVVLNPSTPVGRDRGNRRRRRLRAGDVGESRDSAGRSSFRRACRRSPPCAHMLDRAGNRAPIEIDGGIDLSNIARVVEAGAEIVVAGSAIFNTPDPAAATRALKDAAAAVAS